MWGRLEAEAPSPPCLEPSLYVLKCLHLSRVPTSLFRLLLPPFLMHPSFPFHGPLFSLSFLLCFLTLFFLPALPFLERLGVSDNPPAYKSPPFFQAASLFNLNVHYDFFKCLYDFFSEAQTFGGNDRTVRGDNAGRAKLGIVSERGIVRTENEQIACTPTHL